MKTTRTTHTKASDYPAMLRLAAANVGSPAVTVIDSFAAKLRIVHHRAGKVFWGLVDNGAIVCQPDSRGVEIIQSVSR